MPPWPRHTATCCLIATRCIAACRADLYEPDGGRDADDDAFGDETAGVGELPKYEEPRLQEIDDDGNGEGAKHSQARHRRDSMVRRRQKGRLYSANVEGQEVKRVSRTEEKMSALSTALGAAIKQAFPPEKDEKELGVLQSLADAIKDGSTRPAEAAAVTALSEKVQNLEQNMADVKDYVKGVHTKLDMLLEKLS